MKQESTRAAGPRPRRPRTVRAVCAPAHSPRRVAPVIAPVIALAATLALGACGGTGAVRPDAESGPLDAWVDRELAPYLVDELANDPRFSGASIQLVKLDGEEISPRIDALVDDIRANLFNALVATPGIDLAWRPAVRPWQHHRTLAEMDCGIRKRTTHYVGIDHRRGIGGRERVNVRALDIESRQWVSGFESSWSGQLSAGESSAAEESFADRYLRGLRPLPFEGDQADLATSYLAHNLSCLLREGAPERLTLHVQAPPGEAPAFFHTVSALAGRYMNQFREVRLVDSADAADAVVDSEMVQISDDLWQVWMGVTYRDAGKRVSGADTPAYVSLDAAEGRRRAQGSPIRTEPSAPSTPVEPVVTPANTPSSEPPVASAPPVSTPTPSPIPTPTTRSVRIDAFNGVVPVSQALCAGGKPWVAGERALEAGEVLGRQDCFALEASIEAEAAFLVTRSGEGEWFRLIDSSCEGTRFADPATIARRARLRFPEAGAMQLTGDGEEETFYLVAAGTPRAAERVGQTIATLPDQCSGGPGASDSPLVALNDAAAAHRGDVVWRRLYVRHRP